MREAHEIKGLHKNKKSSSKKNHQRENKEYFVFVIQYNESILAKSYERFNVRKWSNY